MKNLIFFTFTSTLLLADLPTDKKNIKSGQNIKLKKHINSINDNGPSSTFFNINSWKIQMEHQGFFQWNGTSHGSAGNYPKNMGSVIFAEGILWGVKVTDKFGVNSTTGEILTDSSGSGLPRVRVNGSMYNTGLKAGKVLRDANGKIKTKDYAENYRDQQIWRVRKDWNTGDLTVDASIIRDISTDQVTEAMMTADKAQYEHDWKNWPADEGAPYYDSNSDGSYTPATWNSTTNSWDGDIPGYPGSDQTIWTVANDLPDEYAEGGVVSVSEGGWGSPPIGFELQITLWGYNAADNNPLSSVMFKEAKLIYVGLPGGSLTAKLDTVYLTQWSDPDLGTYTDDYVGSDVELSLGYVYNGNNFDDQFRDQFTSPVPAAGYDFLEGPKVDVNGDGVLDTLGMTSFVYFASGGSVSDPSSQVYSGTLQWFNLMEGYLPRPEYPTQQPFVDPITGNAEKFVLSGDPVRGIGWVDGIILPPGDRRLAMNTGPFEMALGDTQKIVTALIGGMGSDNLTSVATLKYNDKHVQYLYDNNFKILQRHSTPVVSSFGGDKEVFIDWNNEYNRNNIENNPSGKLPFEGYVIWQYSTATNNWGPVTTFSKSQRNVYADVVDNATGLVVPRVLHKGDRSLAHQFVVTHDRNGNPLENNREYTFAIAAYGLSSSVNAIISSIENYNSSTGNWNVFNVTPRNGVSGVDYKDNLWYTNTDTSGYTVAHTAGTSDGQVQVRITNPNKIKAGDYTVVFENDDQDNLYWDLIDKTTEGVLLDNYSISNTSETIFNGNDFGFQIRVAGPPNAFTNFTVVANKGAYDGGTPNDAQDDTNCTEDSPCQGSQDWGGFPTVFTGRINQSDGKGWFFHAGGAADNSYDTMISRIIRGSGWKYLVPNDFEYRFTYADSNYAYAAYTSGSLVRVPFEIWDVTNGVRLIPWFYDYDGNEAWGLHANDHPGSGGSNDPYTDWTYPHLPADVSKGDKGYKDWLEASIALGGGSPDANGRYDGTSATYYESSKDGPEVMGRNVFYVWNLDDVSDGTINVYAGEDVNGDGTPDNIGPEKGTVFRITTAKSIQVDDVYTFTVEASSAFTVAKGDVNLDKTVDVADVVSTVDHIIEASSLSKSSQEYAADFNSDYYINIADGVGMVNKILGVNGKLLTDNNLRLHKSAPATIALDKNILVVEDNINVRIKTDKGSFAGMQFVLSYSSDMGIKPLRISTQKNGLVKEFYSKSQGESKFIVMSMNGYEFASTDEITISLSIDKSNLDQLDDLQIKLSDVILSDAQGNVHDFTVKNTIAKYTAIPTEFTLHDNYPNPFNPSTLIPFDISEEAFVSIKIMDILGREVATLVNENKLPGKHNVRWFGKSTDLKQMPSGIYFVKFKANSYTSLKKITLLK